MPRWEASSRREIALVGMTVGVGGTAVAVGVSVGSDVGVGVLDGGSNVAVGAICGEPHPTNKMDTSKRLAKRNERLRNNVTPFIYEA
jgi:hypothetical protein